MILTKIKDCLYNTLFALKQIQMSIRIVNVNSH